MEPSLAKPRVAPSEPVPEASQPVEKGVPETSAEAADDLYATYELDHHIPFVADHYGLKELWNNKDLTYETEVKTIDSYLMDEIKAGQLDNSTKSVKNVLSKLERLAGVNKDAPTSVKVQQLAEFTKYLKTLSEKGIRL